MAINLTDTLNAATTKGKLADAKQIYLEGDTQTVQKEIEDINSRHNDLKSKHETVSDTVSKHTKQITDNQSQITANKSAQDAKNASLDASITKLNTRDDQITKTLESIIATGGASTATDVTYDNTTSGLTSVNVKGAIDELANKKADKTAVEAETKRAQSAEQANAQAISDEVAERTKAVNELTNQLYEIYTVYGIEFDTAISSPTCTRIGRLDLHRTLPIQSKMRGCLLDDDGNVVKYLDAEDWTNEDRTGSSGQVMVEIPMHYRRFDTEGTKRRVYISELSFPGCEVVPKAYVSAYEATIQRSTSKLCSVVNEDTDYRGGDNNADYDGTYRSLLGRPASNINLSNFRKYARNRKSGSTEWNCYTYDIHKTLFWLFVVEYATLNSQAEYNSEPTSEGYRQGGLGEGVATWNNQWVSFNSNCPFVPCGHTDSLGNHTGVVPYTAKNDDKSISKTFDVPRYRGIENPFGHIWKITDGYNIQVSASQDNGGTGLSKAFICHNPANFQDSNYANYSYVGNISRVGGYIKEVLFGVGGEILPKLTGGGSTIYFCDACSTRIPTSGEVLYTLMLGGNANYSQDISVSSGLTALSLQQGPYYANKPFGSRLCFIPSEE